MTIRESILEVLIKYNIKNKLTAEEIKRLIIESDLYIFNAQSPRDAVASELYRMYKRGQDYLSRDEKYRPYHYSINKKDI